MDARPIDLIGGFGKDDSLPWNCQDLVNWIPEAAEMAGTRTPSMLRDAPGLRPLYEVGDGPIRGMRNVEGKLLVVSGNTLYQVTPAGVIIERGTIPGVGLVSMTHNQRAGTNQLLILNGAAGYIYDTSATTLTKISDGGYPGAFVGDFIDGYFAQIEPGRRYWFHSALQQGLDYNTLDRYTAEGQPDPLVTLLVDHREVWVFGQRTIEPFVNTGAATNTFARASNTVIQHGCAARNSPAQLDGAIIWLDDLGIVRMARGYEATRISNSAVEQAIKDLDWSRAFAYTVTTQGHAIYYLTFPDGYTFGFDVVTGLWHRRASYGLDRWRVNAMVYWQGQYIGGDYQSGQLYTMDWDYPFDGVLPHVRTRVTGVTHADQNRVLIPYAEIVTDAGRPNVAPGATGDWVGIADSSVAFSFDALGQNATRTGSTVSLVGTGGMDWAFELTEAGNVQVRITSAGDLGAGELWWLDGSGTDTQTTTGGSGPFAPSPFTFTAVADPGENAFGFLAPDFEAALDATFLVEVFEVGAAADPSNDEQVLQIAYSDDGGNNYSNWRQIGLGLVGEYNKRQRIRRLGSARKRVWKLQTAATCTVNVLGAVVQSEAASN